MQSASKLLDAFKRGAEQPKVTLDHLPELVDRLCSSDLLIFQIAGIQYGKRFSGAPSMAGWQVPEHLKQIDRYLTRLNLAPSEVLTIMEGRT